MSDYLDHLDQGLLIDIFSRLPVETLARLTFVCKSWRSFITSPDFIYHPLIRNALTRNANDRRLLLVGYRTYVPKQDPSCLTDRYHKTDHYSLMVDGSDSFRQLKAFHLPFDSLGNSIVGIVNGVICLSGDFKRGYTDDMFLWNPSFRTMFLWNPSIRKCVALPKYDAMAGQIRPFLGFGFDPVTNDFKVVRIHTHKKTLVELYTHKTRCWRNISEKALPAMIVEHCQAYVNGASYWVAATQVTALGNFRFRYTILSFDMSAEVFKEILIPESVSSVSDEDRFKLKLVVFKESLHLIQEFLNNEDPHCAVWIMKEYSVSTSWSRLFRIDLSGVLRSPLALRENGEVIFETHDGKLVSCDHQSRHITYLGIRGTDTDSGYFHSHRFYVETYTESLELLN